MSVEIYATLGEPHEVAATLSELRYLVFQGMKGDTGDKGDKGDVGALADLDASYDETTKTLSLGTNATSLAIEDRLSATSTNPVQNRIITSALNGKQDKLTAGQNITISGDTISADVDSAEIAANVTDWLDDNVTPVGSAVVVDSSLSVQGAAADAAAVGSLKSAFDDSQYFGYNLVLDNFATSSEWSAYNSTAVFGTNTVTLTATASGSNEANIRYSKKITKFVSGHKYYVSCQIKSTVRFRARIYVGNTPTDRLGYESGVWNIVDGIAAPTSNSELGFYAINHAGGVVGDVFELKNPVLIDLTEMYGAGNEPTTVQTLRKIINGDYVDAFSGKRYQEIMGAKTAGAVIVASKDSSYVGRADYVAVGKADQVLLNELISNPSISSIYLAPDSVFSISAPINLKSNFKLFSDGAKITMEDQVSVISTGNAAVGDVNLYASTDVGVNDFAVGMFVEISNGTNTESHTIASISYGQGKITLDEGVAHAFAAGSTVKNVSSALAGFDLSDVVVEGIRVDLNLENNPQAVNTFYAQNGAHFVRCTRVQIRNCAFNNGGRHGILFYEVNDSSIKGCYLDNWEEHCIDLYESGTGMSTDGTPRNNLVSECVLTNATLAGVQNHGGSGNVIDNCVMHGNGECGVSCYGGANNIIISNCRITGNTAGVKAQTNAKYVSVIGCDLSLNTNDGISVFKTVDHLLASGNQIHENGRDGVQLDSGTQNALIVGNNICQNTQYQIFIVNSGGNCVENNIIQGSNNARCIYLYRTCEKNIIRGNTFLKGNSTYAIRNDSGSISTVAVNNVFDGFSTPINDTGTGTVAENNYSI